jgi:hypothetical protein
MISRKLVSQIERNAEKLAADLVQAVKHDLRAEAYHQISDRKFEEYVIDLYRNLGRWLRSQSRGAVRTIYERKGRDRYHDGLPLSQVVFSFTMTKSMLLEYVRAGVHADSDEREMELDLVHAISGFFDRVIYHIVLGYEDARRADLANPMRGEEETLAMRKNLVIEARKSSSSLPVPDLDISRSGDVGEVAG